LWVCAENCGKPTPQLVSARKKNGYAEVHRGNFNGALDHMCGKHDDGIRHEGLILMARPVQIERIAKQYDARAAKAAIENMRKSHRDEGVSGVTMPDANVEHVRKRNAHRTTYEEGPKIPD
jgi:hypothetical protein